MRRALMAALAAALAAPAMAAPLIVKVEQTPQGWRLLRDGQPYSIKGAGGDAYLDALKAAGANSVRTWGADNLEPLLDEAQALGLSVTVGIWLGQPRQGFDYGKEEAVRRQQEAAVAVVRRYRAHPAVLLWGLGNEAEGDGADPRIWRAIDDLAVAVKQEDPNHPTMTVVAEIGRDKARRFQELCPHVDILGINSYAGLPSLPGRLQEQGMRRPWVVTEFGPQGAWEVRKTAWGAPIEATSTEKAEQYLRSYRESIAGQPGRCLGSYAFLWGHKQEATATWFGMLLRTGEFLGAADAMTFAWSGRWPANRCPRVERLETSAAEKEVAPGVDLAARLVATDPNGDPLTVRWELRHESADRRGGGDLEREPLPVPGAIARATATDVQFRAPRAEGAYRLYVYVYDGRGGGATANAPLFVKVPRAGAPGSAP